MEGISGHGLFSFNSRLGLGHGQGVRLSLRGAEVGDVMPPLYSTISGPVKGFTI